MAADYSERTVVDGKDHGREREREEEPMKDNPVADVWHFLSLSLSLLSLEGKESKHNES